MIVSRLRLYASSSGGGSMSRTNIDFSRTTTLARLAPLIKQIPPI
jgi:hypothetical protein